MAPDQPYRLGSPETETLAPTDGLDTARGFIVGMAIGLGLWIAVIVLAMVIA